MEALVGQRVVQVSCGSRDAQTLALVEGKIGTGIMSRISTEFRTFLLVTFPGVVLDSDGIVPDSFDIFEGSW